MLQVGARLRWLGDGTGRLTYADVLALTTQAGRDTAVARHEVGEHAEWTPDTYLIAGVLDALNNANWQRGGGRGAKPDSVPRPAAINQPGTTSSPATSQPQQALGESFEPAAMTLDEVNEFLGITTRPQPVLSAREQAVIEYNAGGSTYAQLAEKYGVSASTVGRWVRSTNTLDDSLRRHPPRPK